MGRSNVTQRREDDVTGISQAETASSAMQKRHACAIVVPCYNEASRLDHDTFLAYAQASEGIRFLFVNDGSRDGTLSMLEALRMQCPGKIEVLDKQPNGGKAEAVRAGMLKAVAEDTVEGGRVEYVGFWDADLATPLDAIPEFLNLLNARAQVQMVFGARIRLLGRHVNRNAARHYLGRVFASVVSIILRLPIYDTQCGAKIFRVTPELTRVLKAPFLSRWIFDVEIIARYLRLHHGDAQILHDTIYELPLARWDDVAGSKVGPGAFATAFLDLWRIYFKYLR
jgi:dolichyl-phosphate beta-glucosyltransferase